MSHVNENDENDENKFRNNFKTKRKSKNIKCDVRFFITISLKTFFILIQLNISLINYYKHALFTIVKSEI